MRTHDELERELRWLDARMPGLVRDMDAFFGAFESAGSVRPVGGAQVGDHAWLEGELPHMAQRHGIAPGNPAP